MNPADIPLCQLCNEPILDNEPLSPSSYNGKPVHWECGFRSAVGGANHILRLCACYGGTLEPDRMGRTKRQAAQEAVEVYNAIYPT